jgi:mannose-6-phosphate isomerase
VEQRSNIQQHAMPFRTENGEKLLREEWEKNIDSLIEELHWQSHPEVLRGTVSEEGNAVRCLCCEGSYFRLERVRTRGPGRVEFDGAIMLTNLGDPVLLETKGVSPSRLRTLKQCWFGCLRERGISARS